MGTYCRAGNLNTKAMDRVLGSLDDELLILRKRINCNPDLTSTIRQLRFVHEMSSELRLDATSDLSYQISTLLLEFERSKIPFDQKVMTHLYVARSLIHEAFESYLNKSLERKTSRESALIGSFNRCIRELARENKSQFSNTYEQAPRWERTARQPELLS